MFDIQVLNEKIEEEVKGRGVGLKPNMKLTKVDRKNKFA